ncbi:MAG: hypothetical protein JWP02_2145 [Acidimicrobiales bacterium]|nr:hypothetical protein [Acidimicrobiales bacterium]
MTDELAVLEVSVARLRDLMEPLGPEERRASAYPTEWTVADVLSHLGSGAVLSSLRLDVAFRGGEVDSQPVWDEWNAKDPDSKVADALEADQALDERLAGLTEGERGRVSVEFGPLKFDYDGFVRLRINEHVLHSWDVAVAFDPGATLLADGVPAVLEAVPMIATFSGKATGSTSELRVRTTGPDRRFVVRLGADGVALEPDDAAAPPDVTLPAEAFIRLVYGRLDPDHTPAFEGDEADLAELRRAFPGI